MHVIAHGGAGGEIDEPAPRQAAIEEAVARGCDATEPLDAAIATVRFLEANPRFNAGVGSAVQSDGVIRTDAGLMSSDGSTGAACSMAGVEAAVEVARVVAMETPHVLLAGDRAVALADAYGVPTDCDLWSQNTRERWAALDPPADESLDVHLEWVHDQFGGSDTVGAVATGGERIVAVTSTGGRWCALAGRVGDVPQIGAGFYASETAAARATGAGEAIARFGLARRTVELVEDGLGPQLAADRAIDRFEDATGDGAGVIVLDRSGRAGKSYNTDAMQTAVSQSPEER